MSEVIEVLVGRIGKPHGIGGQVTVEVRTDEPERRFVPGAILRAVPPRAQATTLGVVSVRYHQQALLVAFEGVGDRNAAESLRGTMLYADVPADAVPEDPEEFYDHQLRGLEVYDTDGTLLGTLTDVLHPGAQDLLVVTTTTGREALVPFVTALVPTVDLAQRRVVVADRPGLISLAEDA